MTTRRARHKWGKRDWAFAISTGVGIITILTAFGRWVSGGKDSVNRYVDGRARTVAEEVVHDSLYVHRVWQHRHDRDRDYGRDRR